MKFPGSPKGDPNPDVGNSSLNPDRIEAMSHQNDFSLSGVSRLPAQLGDELRERGGLRSATGPFEDLAVRLFCSAFGWARAATAHDGYDACDAAGQRYLVRGCRITLFDGSRRLSPIRNLPSAPFSMLAGAMFDVRNNVLNAGLVPLDVVAEHAVFHRAVNAHILHLSDDGLGDRRTLDVTNRLIEASYRG